MMKTNRTIWTDGIMSVIIKDALGCPVQFREGGADGGRFERQRRNIEIFQDTVRRCRQTPRLMESIEKSVKGRELFPGEMTLPGAERRVYADSAAIAVSGKRSFEAAAQYRGKKTCVLNFASAVNPGGGVQRGASAQEEALCRCSTLYFTLDSPEMTARFYRPHRESGSSLYNDDIIYSPDITVFKRDDTFPEMLPEDAWYQVDVLTCAAPNLRDMEILEQQALQESSSVCIRTEDLEQLLRKRIRRIFEIAAYKRNEVLILGAFGCGAFRNPPVLAAKIFREVTREYSRAFEKIEYAVFHTEQEQRNYDAFSNAFKDDPSRI